MSAVGEPLRITVASSGPSDRPRELRPSRLSAAQVTALDLHGSVQGMMLRATGVSYDEHDERPLIGIANSWTELGPCNFGLLTLAEQAASTT